MALFDVSLDDLRRRTSIKWRRFEPDVLPMFVAEMDVKLAAPVAARLQRAIADGDTGYPELPVYQEAFASFAEWMWGWAPDPAADMCLAGDVMSGMRELLLATTEPGDAVVINPAIYPPFRLICDSTARPLLQVPMRDDGRLDLEGLEEAFSGARGPKPTAYLLCSPHNPHGTIHTRDELAAVARMAATHRVTVISDEIHAPLVGSAHVPFVTLPGAQRSFVVTSASKSWNLAGLKAGLLIAGSEVRETLRALPGHVHESVSHLGVMSHAVALNDARDWLQELTLEIQQNKVHFAAELARQVPALSYTPSEGTYLAWLDCSPLGLESPARRFHEVGRVRMGFGTDYDPSATQHVRVNLGTSRELITEGVRRMAVSL
ncbi:MalY/PatB family protein [Tessaracoccus antarcticus]|uniref:cysteine-S-conjugate beta-lyase n=1 Tax=Tessaracoccus antarcticus TaxID=2479848 RepID=A0A3M0GC16_9ACTN|nr:aminotransferase class I/II-fold pyridoxal phosphate-dependent enzyme [Tessaracoccus antarcticus]RMB61977.1 aminotransferase class I/II-fold pyridoxal phosphate-dependent enzyme [Tessaracoccus antarcticus]